MNRCLNEKRNQHISIRMMYFIHKLNCNMYIYLQQLQVLIYTE